jgi:hypothetical protein
VLSCIDTKVKDTHEVYTNASQEIRSQQKTTEAGGEKTEAEVVLAINWDQLTG